MRSTQQEAKKAEKKLLEAHRPASPKKIEKIIKKLPPFISDNIRPEDILMFQEKGNIGWGYMTREIFQDSKAVAE